MVGGGDCETEKRDSAIKCLHHLRCDQWHVIAQPMGLQVMQASN